MLSLSTAALETQAGVQARVAYTGSAGARRKLGASVGRLSARWSPAKYSAESRGQMVLLHVVPCDGDCASSMRDGQEQTWELIRAWHPM